MTSFYTVITQQNDWFSNPVAQITLENGFCPHPIKKANLCPTSIGYSAQGRLTYQMEGIWWCVWGRIVQQSVGCDKPPKPDIGPKYRSGLSVCTVHCGPVSHQCRWPNELKITAGLASRIVDSITWTSQYKLDLARRWKFVVVEHCYQYLTTKWPCICVVRRIDWVLENGQFLSASTWDVADTRYE